MENEPSDVPGWASPQPGSTNNVVGIDLTQLSSDDLQKFISLMGEIDYTPMIIGVDGDTDNDGN
jgi:hypothetical protein